MTRRRVCRSLPGMLLLVLMAGLGLPGAVPAGQAAPHDGAGPGEVLTTVQSLSGVDGPSGRFAFGRVQGQATGTETTTPTATVTPTTTPTSTATGTVATATPTATGTLVTATPTPTVTTGVPPTPPVSGTPGIGCATVIGQSCTAVGAVAGTWTKTGNPGGTFALTATGPVNATVGGTPVLFIPTTVNPNGEQFTCTATSAALTTTCNGTTVGDPLCGGTVTVNFPLTTGGFGAATGVITCAGQSTLIVCKQLQVFNQTGPGFTNFPGSQGGLGFNTFPGLQGGLGLNSGLGFNDLGLQGVTVTFTTPPGGPAIPAITLPAGQLGPVCATGVTVAPGTVAVTEVVPAGFTLQSVTGGTLAGNTATATVTAGQTTTLTFVNVPSTIIIPNPPPFLPLPPPPLQFLPPPPPPLLPPPPMGPLMGGPQAQLAYPEVPVIPEADSWFLMVSGLVVLGGLVGLRNLRRRRDGEA